jgi:hypothetical protein
MPATLTRRLPGFRFEAPPAARTDVLPRMDIAVFVGFAASGPLNVPVKVEDEAEFEDIFGTDAPLAWDGEINEPIYAYLASAVRGFFRNGGQRCWIVRVADERPPNAFAIPGLIKVTFQDGEGGGKPVMSAAFANARSQGRWSDALLVSTMLESEPVQVVDFSVDNQEILLTSNSPIQFVPGDLIRVQYGEPGLFMLLPVETFPPIEPKAADSPPGAPSKSRLLTRVSGGRALFLAASGLQQPTLGAFTVQLFESPATPPRTCPATIPLQTSGSAGSPPQLAWPTGGSNPTVTICLDLPLEQAPPIGSSVQAVIGPDTLWMTVEQYDVHTTAGSPPGTMVNVTGPAWWASALPFSPLSPPSGLPVLSADRLTFAFSVLLPDPTSASAGRQTVLRLDGLAFGPEHPRYWNGLPDDKEFFVALLPDASGTPPALWSELTKPRFPLAGIADETAVFFPINMSYSAGLFLGAAPAPGKALCRDGLERFKLNWFVDRKLNGVGLLDLSATVGCLQSQMARPRPLKGIHAAFSVEEATIIAAPDAVHRGWTAVDTQPPGTQASSPLEHPEWWHFLPCDPPPTIPLTNVPPRGHFFGCGLEPIPAPQLFVGGQAAPLLSDTGSFTLSWEAVQAAGNFYLEEATAQDFSNAMQAYSGSLTSLAVIGRPTGDYFYRVRLIQGARTSDWSNTVGVRVQDAELWLANPRQGYTNDILLGAHRTLLRTCAARADALAVLSLPDHYLTEQVTEHVQLLAPSQSAFTRPAANVADEILAPPLGYEEHSALSYGALYHPWGLARTPDDVILRSPPDGTACGILARRALERGAWIAPANETWRGLVALTPLVPAEDRVTLQQAQVNLVRQEPRGFLTLSADTLSADDDLRPIQVRRLLILLRRLALALGPTYVFEPNDAAFRRLVQRNFEALLEGLFRGGAFAGATPAESFQVVTGEGLNTPQSVEAGQFIVELRVAPAQALTFVTVRLVQAGNGDLTAQEV